MKSKFLGIGATALFLVATCGTLTSCYEKEDITTVIDNSPKSATYVISGSVSNSANFTAIQGAKLTLSKGTTNYEVSTNANGEFGLSLKFSSDKNKLEEINGAYSLKVEADGFITRFTQIDIQLPGFNNQSVATHMDFILKSKSIQGVPEEVVAGGQDQSLEITGSNPAGSGTTTDKLFIPAGAFGKNANGENIVKTISIERTSDDEETVAAARFYIGKPDGTIFELPLVIEFEYPDALVGSEGLKVLFKQADGTWIEKNINNKENKVEKVAGKANTYKASIYHFSTFMFGQSAKNVFTKETVKEAGVKLYENMYYNSENKTVPFKFTREFAFGSKYTSKTPEETFKDVENAEIKKYLIAQTKKYIDAAMVANAPGSDFIMEKATYTVDVPKHSNLEYITQVRTVENWKFVVTFAGNNYEFSATSVKSYDFTPTTFDYTHGHGIGHGHGHGDELNAGGGIIDFE